MYPPAQANRCRLPAAGATGKFAVVTVGTGAVGRTVRVGLVRVVVVVAGHDRHRQVVSLERSDPGHDACPVRGAASGVDDVTEMDDGLDLPGDALLEDPVALRDEASQVCRVERVVLCVRQQDDREGVGVVRRPSPPAEERDIEWLAARVSHLDTEFGVRRRAGRAVGRRDEKRADREVGEHQRARGQGDRRDHGHCRHHGELLQRARPHLHDRPDPVDVPLISNRPSVAIESPTPSESPVPASP